MLNQELTTRHKREFSSLSTIILSITIKKNNYLKFKSPRKGGEDKKSVMHLQMGKKAAP